ncbi:uncharacterized protein TrAtP1_013187 [Trichoderma atroviride]|nr:hypothetical protein TrAtP1_013187 [Trichoderma atroviride]
MFRSQALAFHVRTLVEEKLMKTLEWLNYSDEQLERKRESKRQQVKTRNANRSAIGEGHVEGVEQHPDDDLVIDELPERTKQEVPAV